MSSIRLHMSDGTTRQIATNVDFAVSVIEQTQGLIGRTSLPADYALVFECSKDLLLGWTQTVHMIGVRTPIDVVWVREGEVTKTATLQPWTGIAFGKADVFIELPAGGADAIAVGDQIQISADD